MKRHYSSLTFPYLMMKLFLFLFAMFYKFTTHIGGQAVMGGLIMRNYERYVLAVRNSGNEIVVERHTWYSLSKHPVLRKTFIRGFPILLETLINGIKALNRSAELIESTPKKKHVHANVFQPCFGYIAGSSALRDHSPFFCFRHGTHRAWRFDRQPFIPYLGRTIQNFSFFGIYLFDFVYSGNKSRFAIPRRRTQSYFLL